MKRRRVTKAEARLMPYEKAYRAFVRTLHCCSCLRPATKRVPNQASHMTLSANEKGAGMLVDMTQVVPHCDLCHRRWDGRAGRVGNPFNGWTKEQRYAMAAGWVESTRLLAIPETLDQARELQDKGLGLIKPDGLSAWYWLPGGDEGERDSTTAVVENVPAQHGPPGRPKADPTLPGVLPREGA